MLNPALEVFTHVMAVVSIVAAGATHSSKASTSSSSSGTLIYLLFMGLIVYVGWRLIFRPQSQRAKQQRQTMTLLSVGDEVMTTSGIFGTVLEIDGDKVYLQVSDGCVLTMVRSAIGQRLSLPAEAGGSTDGPAFDDEGMQDGDGDPDGQYDSSDDEGLDGASSRRGGGSDGDWEDSDDGDAGDGDPAGIPGTGPVTGISGDDVPVTEVAGMAKSVEDYGVQGKKARNGQSLDSSGQGATGEIGKHGNIEPDPEGRH
ncbi:MAG: preprotein translocase subunit YajC [Actinobacteria bacterium]|nr:preprotein translocase subunit YajC [Actinomycetota bacterium]MCL5447471.1 preprotein translocase subunit YajC [Actinomycetota bacterium]